MCHCFFPLARKKWLKARKTVFCYLIVQGVGLEKLWLGELFLCYPVVQGVGLEAAASIGGAEKCARVFSP